MRGRACALAACWQSRWTVRSRYACCEPLRLSEATSVELIICVPARREAVRITFCVLGTNMSSLFSFSCPGRTNMLREIGQDREKKKIVRYAAKFLHLSSFLNHSLYMIEKTNERAAQELYFVAIHQWWSLTSRCATLHSQAIG